ncbi:MAG TPA: hypothetical protein VIU44_09115 [Gaiellaceae bacterium]|jgi:hypothetical protein
MSALWAENRKCPTPAATPRRVRRDRRQGHEQAKLRRLRGSSAVLLVTR